jgi:hypothetical protein
MTDSGHQDEDQAEAGRRRREFIRAHHPDRGGDTETFIAGLRGFENGHGDGAQEHAGAGAPPPRVTIIPRQPWPARLVTAAARRLRHGRPPARVR